MPTDPHSLENRRLEALARCLAPCGEADFGSFPAAEAGARHRLARALNSGFRSMARAELAGHVDDVDGVLDRLPERWWFDRNQLRVVVTGFEPFLDHARNPSWDVARSFADVLAERFSVRRELCAVTYDAAASFCEREAVEQGQRLIVHFGLRGAGAAVDLERYAHNCRGRTRDESGRSDWPDMLVPGGPAALETLLSVRELAGALDEQIDVDAQVSRDVGDYVCNALYYHSLEAVWAAREADGAAEALFVHVPPLGVERAARLGASFGRIFCAHLDAHLDDQLVAPFVAK